jgi:lysozyme family protein
MNGDFNEAFDIVIGHEGGYTANHADPGNWTGGKVGAGTLKGTKYGVSGASYPNEDIPNLTLDRARALYRADYWDKVRGDEVPFPVAFVLFDGAINSGPAKSIMWMQLAAGVADDGKFGPLTLAAILKADPDWLASVALGYRLKFMTGLSTWATFGKGWARRIAATLIGV